MRRREFLLALSAALLLPRRAPAATRCLIIGAGMAGIAAARALQARGVAAPILEARERVGGRIWTDRSLGFPVDLGAAWIEGTEGNPIMKLTQQYKIATLSDDSDYAYFTGRGQPLDLEESLRKIKKQVQALRQKAGPDISYAQALQHHKDLPALEAYLDSLESTWALDASALSLAHGTDEDGYDGEERIFKTGYGTLVEALARGLDVRLGHKVNEIHQEGDRVRVVTSQGVFEAERVIVTVPLGVLQADDVVFSPPLSAARREAFRHLKMGVLDKVVLKFDRAFWPDRPNFNYLSSPRGRMPLVVNWRHFSGHPALVCFTAGSHALKQEARTQAAAVDEVLGQLKLLFARPVPDPSGVLVTRWGHDPLARGSYSGLLVGCSGRERAVLARAQGRVHFAGEATSTEQPACVPGALLSGRRAAAEVLSA